jgi:hypothetical protein
MTTYKRIRQAAEKAGVRVDECSDGFAVYHGSDLMLRVHGGTRTLAMSQDDEGEMYQVNVQEALRIIGLVARLNAERKLCWSRP